MAAKSRVSSSHSVVSGGMELRGGWNAQRCRTHVLRCRCPFYLSFFRWELAQCVLHKLYERNYHQNSKMSTREVLVRWWQRPESSRDAARGRCAQSSRRYFPHFRGYAMFCKREIYMALLLQFSSSSSSFPCSPSAALTPTSGASNTRLPR